MESVNRPAATFSAAFCARRISARTRVTEIVYALALGKRVVAVDSTSRYRPSTAQLPDVGYRRALSAEHALEGTGLTGRANRRYTIPL